MPSGTEVNKRRLPTFLTIGLAAVWFVNGLFCKVLDLVPRHRMIVARILGAEYASAATRAIGLLELLMVVWILSGIRPRLCAGTQMIVVAAMVPIECLLTPDLLLFGRANLVPAGLLIAAVYLDGFVLPRASTDPLSRGGTLLRP
jgi:hypothetical protein